jgi:dsDNA-binding SOS-regulon protein
MQHHNLPTEDLKTYGIIDEDLTFSKKLSADDIQKFLSGYTIVADNNKNRATFQLTDNNTQLKVIFLERDKSLSEILRNSKEKVQYTDIKDLTKSPDKWNIEKRLSFSIRKMRK